MASLTCASHTCHVNQQASPCTSQSTSLRLKQQRLRSQIRPALMRPTSSTRHTVFAAASDFEEGELVKGVKAGDRLKVKESRIVYHSPKHKDGLDLKGMEGECIEVIEKHLGSKMSANLPYKTVFMIPKDDGKDQKLVAHLAAGEFDKV